MIINYCKEGQAISDMAAEDFVKKAIEDKVNISVSTENVIEAARTLIAEGAIPYTDITFQFEGYDLEINKYGALDYWPKGFCDTVGNFVGRIIMAGAAGRKRDRLEKETSNEQA